MVSIAWAGDGLPFRTYCISIEATVAARFAGNEGVHEAQGTHRQVLAALKMARELIEEAPMIYVHADWLRAICATMPPTDRESASELLCRIGDGDFSR